MPIDRRILALVLLAVLVAAIVFGIVYVPRHDGRPTDALIGVLLPTAGVCWCLWRLLPRPRKDESGQEETGEKGKTG